MKSSTIGLGLSFGQNLSGNEHLLPHKKNFKKTAVLTNRDQRSEPLNKECPKLQFLW